MAWYRETLKANWSTPNDVKAQFSIASVLRNGRVVLISLEINIESSFGLIALTASSISDLSEHTSTMTKLMPRKFEVSNGNSSD